MVDEIRDRLEEGDGIIMHYSKKAERCLDGHELLNELEWDGRIGRRKGQLHPRTFFHHAGKTEAEIDAADALFKKMQSLENEKELVLHRVKDIRSQLNQLKSPEEKAAYLASEAVQEIFERYEVPDLQGLEEKLSILSLGMTVVREQLSALGMTFGAYPDNFFTLPVMPDDPWSLNYQAILRQMAYIANNPVPYDVAHKNCSTVIVN